MRSLTVLLALLLAPSLHAAELHLLCNGDALDSMVFVNDRYQGNCPLSLTLPPERHALLVQKILPDGTRKIFQSPVDLRHQHQERLLVQLSEPERYRLTLSPDSAEDEEITLRPVLHGALNNDSDAIVALYEYYGGANGFTPQPEKQRAWVERYRGVQWLRLVALRHEAGQGNLHSIYQLINLLHVLQEDEYQVEAAFWTQREQALTEYYGKQHQRYQAYLQNRKHHPWGWPAPNLFESRQSAFVKAGAAIPAIALGIAATPVVAIQRSSNALRYHDVKDGPAHWQLPEELRGGFQQ